ncbi:TRM11 family SAM-dependent methyltransferase [Sedimentisphaera salicampi]|uniref:Methyltransferase n=1 Tax=Sedimentisphaera salicampi TaxID=1941349 RepID=A0A1W6LQC3_9BACT|nr:DNA methyltransferase [Sedimentisphaera salicampi]ARN57964.1 Modification methylase MboII [Sedimentisphaera salicampi]
MTYNSDKNLEVTTVWSFPERGSWATHSSNFRGNFAPQIPRNIMEMFSQPGDYILDPMVGGGTTAIEAKMLARNILASDINPNFINKVNNVMGFEGAKVYSDLKVADARCLSHIPNQSIDLVITHPPYLNIIKYSDGNIPEDLSNIGSLPKFTAQIRLVAKELYRVLKGDKFCAVLIGDTRKGRHYVPLAFNVMLAFLKEDFILKEDIVKVQHNCKMTNRWGWKAKRDKFYLIMHEHLFVFRKPRADENISRLKQSTKNIYQQ